MGGKIGCYLRCNADDVVFSDTLLGAPLVMPLRFSAAAAENADLKKPSVV